MILHVTNQDVFNAIKQFNLQDNVKIHKVGFVNPNQIHLSASVKFGFIKLDSDIDLAFLAQGDKIRIELLEGKVAGFDIRGLIDGILKDFGSVKNIGGNKWEVKLPFDFINLKKISSLETTFAVEGNLDIQKMLTYIQSLQK